MIAVVAAQQPFGTMGRERHAAPRTLGNVAAAAAEDEPGAAPPVDEEYALLAAFETFAERLHQRRAEDSFVAGFELFPEVDDPDGGKRLRGGAFVHFDQLELPGFRSRVALDGRGRAAEQQDAALLLHAFARDRDGVIA